MSNYSKTTDFEAKDSLPTGDSGKIIRGAEFETEFDAISTAIGTKADTAGPTFTGTLTFETISDGTIGVTAFVDEDNMSSNSATLVPTQQSVKAYVDAQVTAQDLDFQADSGGALSIDLDSEALTFTGGTGVDTSGSGNAVTFAIDSTVATLTGTQTLTNKTLTSPDVNTPDIDGGTIDGTVIGGATPAAVSATTVSATGNITVGGTVDGRDVATDGTKLDGIEASATADQTAAEIRTLVGSASDSNVFTDADHSKLDGIEASATADQTAAEIRTLVESASDSNVFTDADHTKLNAIEASATADQTDAEIRAAVEAATDSNVFTDADHTKLNAIEASADVTDTANVTAAGALMDSELTSIASVKALNQGVATTDSPTFAGLTTTADVSFGDNDKAIFGAGSDLQIYHDGSNSYIVDNGTGDLLIRAENNLFLKRTNSDETYLSGAVNGAVTLFHNNNAKLETTLSGIDVTGTVTADGLTVDTGSTFAVSATLGHTGGSQLLFLSDDGGSRNQIDSQKNSASADLDLATGGTKRQRIASNGNISFYEDTGTTAKLFWDASAESLGIGTSSPETNLHIEDSSSFSIIRLVSSTTENAGIDFGDPDDRDIGRVRYNNSDNSMVFHTNAAERMRLDASGNLLVGGTSAFGADTITLGTGGFAGIRNTSGSCLELRRDSTDGSILDFQKDGTTVGSIGAQVGGLEINGNPSATTTLRFGTSSTIYPATDNAGDIGASGNRFKDLYLSGTANVGGVYNTGIYNQQSGDIQFWVPNVGEAVRIQQNTGNLLVGTTSATGSGASSGKQVTQFNGATGNGLYVDDTRTAAGTDNAIIFGRGATITGAITTTLTTTAYVTSSDQRLKDNIVDAPSASDDIDAIQVRSFDWKADGSHQKYGMIAQELNTVAPEAVSAPEDPEDMLGVDYSKLVPMLVKEIQSLRARVAQLETN